MENGEMELIRNLFQGVMLLKYGPEENTKHFLDYKET